MTYNEHVLYDIQPDTIKMSVPIPRPDSRNNIGKVSMVPPMIEFTKAHIVLKDVFSSLITN